MIQTLLPGADDSTPLVGYPTCTLALTILAVSITVHLAVSVALAFLFFLFFRMTESNPQSRLETTPSKPLGRSTRRLLTAVTSSE